MDRSLGPKGDSSPTERERLLLERMPERLARRGRWEDLRRLLSNFTFLTDKVALFGPQALIEDCERSDDPSLRVLELALRQAAHILQDAPGQLPSHVHNLLFLFGGDDEPTRHLLAQAR